MLISESQEQLIVIDPSSLDDSSFESYPNIDTSEPISVVLEPHPDDVESEIFVADPNIEIIISELPGAPEGTKDPEEFRSTSPKEEEEKSKDDENDAKKSFKKKKWDWDTNGASGFINWVKEMADSVPSHSGFDSAGLERALSYMDWLDSEISRGMRLDLDGELDANLIEKVRSKIDDGICRLQERLDKVKKNTKSRRKKKSEFEEEGLIKEAQRISGVKGVYIVADLLTARIAKICINSMVSAGHDIERTYGHLVKKFKLNEREQAQVIELLDNMGYAIRGDRGLIPNEDMDTSSTDNYDYMANYRG